MRLALMQIYRNGLVYLQIASSYQPGVTGSKDCYI